MSSKRFADALESSSNASDDDNDGDDIQTKEVVVKKPKRNLTIQDLEKCGYSDRPSILLIPEPKLDISHVTSTKISWKPKLSQEDPKDDDEDALHEGVEEIADFVVKRMEQAEEFRKARKEEQKKLSKSKRLTFNQKEKAKRNSGRSGSGKNFVEEEKRIGRNLGVYNGFDT